MNYNEAELIKLSFEFKRSFRWWNYLARSSMILYNLLFESVRNTIDFYLKSTTVVGVESKDILITGGALLFRSSSQLYRLPLINRQLRKGTSGNIEALPSKMSYLMPRLLHRRRYLWQQPWAIAPGSDWVANVHQRVNLIPLTHQPVGGFWSIGLFCFDRYDHHIASDSFFLFGLEEESTPMVKYRLPLEMLSLILIQRSDHIARHAVAGEQVENSFAKWPGSKPNWSDASKRVASSDLHAETWLEPTRSKKQQRTTAVSIRGESHLRAEYGWFSRLR